MEDAAERTADPDDSLPHAAKQFPEPKEDAAERTDLDDLPHQTEDAPTHHAAEESLGEETHQPNQWGSDWNHHWGQQWDSQQWHWGDQSWGCNGNDRGRWGSQW